MRHDLCLRRAVPVTLCEAGVYTLEFTFFPRLDKSLDLSRGPAEDFGNGDNHTIAIGGTASGTQPDEH